MIAEGRLKRKPYATPLSARAFGWRRLRSFSTAAATPFVAPGLGFLGTAPFAYETPSFWGFDFLGFPWILSSGTRVINGLHEISARNFFLRAFVVANAPSKRRPHDSACEKDGVFMGQA
jgi:hypothetical protein